MKTTQIFMAILLFAVFTGCNNDDDNNNPIPNTVTWNLTHVSGGIAGADETFPVGFIKWTFNNDSQMLTVENNNTDNTVATIFETGIYPYSRQNNGTNDVITIDNQAFIITAETEHELTLDQIVVEGYTLTLTK